VGAGALFFPADFLTGATFFNALVDGAFTAAFFPATFLGAASADFAAALCRRHRFFVAAMILFMPSALIRRLGLGVFSVAGGGAISPLTLAHRTFCARAIFFRDAALNLLRLRMGASGVEAGSTCAPVAGPSTSLNARSARSMAVLCRSSWVMMLANPSVIR